MPGATASICVTTLLALTIFLAPALGVPSKLTLQDTLKSMVVSFGVLLAAGSLFVELRSAPRPLRWHAGLLLPLLLMACALGSIAWSHHALASVEAIRWFVFALLMFVTLNASSRERLPLLALGVHAGAAVASLWTVLQFLVDLQLFPQAPNPASTFANRNFYAEFAVCTIPFGALLLAQARRTGVALVLAATNALVLAGILMTGTRSALVALGLQLIVVLPLGAWRCRGAWTCTHWPRRLRLLALAVFLGVLGVLGAWPTGNAQIAREGRGLTGFERALQRGESITPGDESLGVRMRMWKLTLRMIVDRPLQGVGAGAWEVEMPLYQTEGAQLETDYYAHNEFLQLAAEDGLAGALFIVGLCAWLLHAGWRTLREGGRLADAERPGRAAVLASLLALMVVSNVGFPWRLASTGALFALCLGALAASDLRLDANRVAIPREVLFTRGRASFALACTALACALAAFISVQAARSEALIVHAAELAKAISASGEPNDPRWDAAKADMLASIHAGIAINPHYRKITPVVADALGRWGDWRDAIPIWQSVLASRPYVVAILSNVARGYLALSQPEAARPYVERALALQPHAPAVRAAQVLLLARTGQDAQALARGREAIAVDVRDVDMANTVFALASRARDWELAEQAIRLRNVTWPEMAVEGWLQLARMDHDEAHDLGRAVEAYRQALALVPESQRAQLMETLPADVRAPLAGQTSASKG